jgi:hypothetical protein
LGGFYAVGKKAKLTDPVLDVQEELMGELIFPKPQAKQSLDPRDYKVVVCVGGSRYYNDRRYFHKKIVEFLETQTEDVLFVSGAAHSGADDLIIRWCEKFRYPCLRMPADWNNDKGVANFNPRTAGFIRNADMASIITYYIGFWNGKSPGTGHMIECCEERKIPMEVIRIPMQPALQKRNASLPNSSE